MIIANVYIFVSTSIVCRNKALGSQGKQHLSVINRVTAWKEEALGLILISLPRSELWRCCGWDRIIFIKLFSPGPAPRGRIDDGLASLSDVLVIFTSSGREATGTHDPCLWCWEPWMSRQLSKAGPGSRGKCISHYSAQSSVLPASKTLWSRAGSNHITAPLSRSHDA